MAQTTMPGDLMVEGTLTARIVASRTASITNAMVSATAAIDATKMQHQHQHPVVLQNHGSAPTAVRKTIARVRGLTGTVVRFEAGIVQPLTVGSVTVDLYKNGSTILSAVITLNTTVGTGGVAYNTVVGTLASASLVQDDVLEVVVAVTTPTGGGGLFCQLTTREDAA